MCPLRSVRIRCSEPLDGQGWYNNLHTNDNAIKFGAKWNGAFDNYSSTVTQLKVSYLIIYALDHVDIVILLYVC